MLDLRYEARNIDQHLTSPAQVDKWFEAKTKGMTDLSRAELKKRWGTMQKVVSAEPRSRQIVNDILLDMETKPRLMDGRGNAILVGSSIYQACTFYELFCQAGFKGKCAIVTSYQPQPGDIAKENAGEGLTEKLRQYEIYRQMLADHFSEPADTAMYKVEQFEQDVKERFIKHPGQMRLLIVVDKLLTGFDAPSATYLYIDKTMRDHGLFQAICRVNRLDGDDKDYGYIVDYRDLFNSLQSAITDYTSGALDGYEKQDIEGLLSGPAGEGAKRISTRRWRPSGRSASPSPRREARSQYQQYFCASRARQRRAAQGQRAEARRTVQGRGRRGTRCYGNIANEMEAAGYTAAEAAAIKAEIAHYAAVRDEVKLGAGENIDFKQYEAGMRFLLDTYIQADASETVADFKDTGLVQLIVQMGDAALGKLPKGIRQTPMPSPRRSPTTCASVIIDEHAMNPKYYDKMSELLDALIEAAPAGSDRATRSTWTKLIALRPSRSARSESDTTYPAWADNGARRALIDFGLTEEQAVAVDRAVMQTKPDQWVGNPMKERRVYNAPSARSCPQGYERLDELFDLIKARDEYR